MSVINKMLRDLDSRKTADGKTKPSSAADYNYAFGTTAVKLPGVGASRHEKPAFRLKVVVLLMVLGLAVLAGWALKRNASPAESVKTIAAPFASVVVGNVSAPTPVASEPAPAASGPAPAASDSVSTFPAVTASAPVPALPASAAVAQAVSPPLALEADPKSESLKSSSLISDALLKASRPDASPASRTGSSPAGTSLAQANGNSISMNSAAPSSSETASTAARMALAPAASLSPVQRQEATLDVMAQAQRLWGGGLRDAAVDLLREAVAAAERSNGSASGADGNTNLVGLVRELVRMELAEGRASRAMDLLVRLEPALAPEADLWAIRGNVAQRLERYADSSKAYLNALKLRPGEPRWMLGAAVSLAIQGQLAVAAELAEQARAVGGLGPEMKTYLQQLGVQIRD